ncbi:hypothetical protein [Telluribacter sp. SYSU D00476]|uniref:hypothetical protein n=1 Tax=Telluribacter sp. SYSU D00476 TaxID=2811430 RepID=UPI001FF22279|nr:hypothetical protein [Telluribacter sp. SYSU D00476]
MLERLKRIPKQDLLGLGIVLVGLIVLNYNLSDRLDVFSDDDDLYWGFAMDYLKGKYRGPDDAVIYCLWQLGIQMLTKDPILTYYINYVAMVSLPCIALYALLRSLRVNVWVSVWLVLLFMFSGLNFPLLPKLTHFTVLFLGAGLAISNFASGNLIKQLMIAGITVWLASYIRPEMYVACGLIILWLLYISYRRKTYRQFATLFSIVLVSAVLLGTPIRKNDRSFWTFKVYMAINYLEWYPGQINLSPWMHFNEINEQIFGHRLVSIRDAIETRPDLVVRHVQTNIVRLVRDSFQYATEYVQMMLDLFPFPHKRYIFPLLGLLFLAMIDYRRYASNLWETAKRYKEFGVILFLTLVPSIITTTTMYPRPHYFLYHFYLLYIPLVGVLLSNLAFRRVSVGSLSFLRSRYTLAAVNLLFMVVFLTPRLMANAQDEPTPKRDFMYQLQGLNLEGEVNLLGGDPITYSRYIREDWTFYFYDNERPESFQGFLRENDINAVIINKPMHEYFKGDPSYQAFLANPDQAGFALIKEVDQRRIYAHRQKI